MSFNRSRAQEYCESLLGCTNLANWNSYKAALESYTLASGAVSPLLDGLHQDAIDFYLKGMHSLGEAIASCRQKRFSWSVIKSYYSVFYFLRSSLALKDYVVIRNKCLFLLRVHPGEQPSRLTANKYRNDHIGAINIYRDLYSSSDLLQSNSINGQNSYEWLMDRRHQVNYWEREFHDPAAPNFLSVIEEDVTNGRFEKRLKTYIKDVSLIYCFQEDHAMLALPIKRAIFTRGDFATCGIHLIAASPKIYLLHDLFCITEDCSRGSSCNLYDIAKL